MEKSKLPIMVNISFLYLIAWCISPPLSVGTFFRVVAIATSLYLFGWFVYHNKQGVNGLVLISLVIIAIVVMVCLITYQNILSQFQFFIFLFFIILFTLYQDSDCIEIDLSYIITFAMLLYIVWNITSIIGLSTIPNAMRLLAKSNDETNYLLRIGIGGFGYLYSLLIMFPVGLSIFMNKTCRQINRMIALVFLISTVWLVFISQYFLSMLLIFFIPVIMVIFRIHNTAIRILLIILIIFFIILIFINAAEIINFLRSINPARSIDEKLRSMYEMLYSGVSVNNSEFSVRYERYQKSFFTILTHPVFGSWNVSETGHHSFWLDFFAQFGIPVGSLLIYLFVKPFRTANMFKSTVVKTSFLILVIMLFLNQIALVFGTVMFLIIPINYFNNRVKGKLVTNE